jgi:hypothetical protein
MSGFGGLVPATLAYSTLRSRRNQRRPLALSDLMTSSASTFDSPDEQSPPDSPPTFGQMEVARVLEMLAALGPVARLLQSLQDERAHTACWVASLGAAHADAISGSRAATDAALASRGAAAAYEATLSRLRDSANRDVGGASAGPAAVGVAYYGCLSGYTELIDNVQTELGAFTVCAATATFSGFSSLLSVMTHLAAAVAGALLLPDAALPAVRAKLRADVVIALHRRKAFSRVIRHRAPRGLLRLLSAGMEMSPPLARTLAKLEARCSLSSLRGSLSPDGWWQVVSAHVDVLRRLQSTLIGECELTARRRAAAMERAQLPRFSELDRPMLSSSSSPTASPSSSPVARMAALGIRRSGMSGTYLQPGVPPPGEAHAHADEGGVRGEGVGFSRADSYTRLFGASHWGGKPWGRGQSGRTSDRDLVAWRLLNSAALLTLGRAGVHESVGGGAELSSWLRSTPAAVLKARLCELVEAQATGGVPSPTFPASPRASPCPSPELTRACRTSSGSSGAGARPARLSDGMSMDGLVEMPGCVSAPPRISAPPPVSVQDEEEPAWRILLHELLFEHRIGEGGSGATYLAEWNGAQVAVKVAGGGGSSRWLEAWRAEVAALTQLRHPNFVEYLGCVVEPPTYCLVLEYCPGGDLYAALRRPTSPGLAAGVLRGVAAGMAYLHSRRYIHRDLKSSNVLLDSVGRPKLMDFGLSRRLEDGDEGEMTAETGTYRWMAPEVIRHESYTQSADVFSFGMLVFELLTHQVREGSFERGCSVKGR